MRHRRFFYTDKIKNKATERRHKKKLAKRRHLYAEEKSIEFWKDYIKMCVKHRRYISSWNGIPNVGIVVGMPIQKIREKLSRALWAVDALSGRLVNHMGENR